MFNATQVNHQENIAEYGSVGEAKDSFKIRIGLVRGPNHYQKKEPTFFSTGEMDGQKKDSYVQDQEKEPKIDLFDSLKKEIKD